MSKLKGGINTLKAAHLEISEVANVSGILVYDDTISVHVRGLRDLEQVPGQLVFEDDGKESPREFPIRAVKVYEGVEFFCLLRRDKYEKAV